MKKKGLVAILLIVVLSLFLTGCQEESSIATEDGEIITYTKEEATEIGGFFLMKGEDEFQKFLSAGLSSSVGRFMWYTNFDHLIPELKSTDEKIVYISSVDRPSMYEFVEMKDMGYTVGVGFTELSNDQDEKEFTFNPNLTNSFSPAAPYLDHVVGGGYNNIKITEVNGREFKESMLTPEGFMKGLTKHAMYRFWFYQGTQYNSISLLADSRLFVENMSYFSKSHKEKKDVYFEVDIPKEMPNGYYVIEGPGGGMFKYNIPVKK